MAGASRRTVLVSTAAFATIYMCRVYRLALPGIATRGRNMRMRTRSACPSPIGRRAGGIPAAGPKGRAYPTSRAARRRYFLRIVNAGMIRSPSGVRSPSYDSATWRHSERLREINNRKAEYRGCDSCRTMAHVISPRPDFVPFLGPRSSDSARSGNQPIVYRCRWRTCVPWTNICLHLLHVHLLAAAASCTGWTPP